MEAHDFKNYPELTNSQMIKHELDSPHPQITKDFWAKVVKVTDGDTIRVEWEERDFDFPVRLSTIAAPELDEEGGPDSQAWLSEMLLGQEVEVIIDPFNRVEKWGRLLGTIMLDGLNINNLSMQYQYSIPFEEEDATT